MKYGLLVRPLAVTALSLFLLGNSNIAKTDNNPVSTKYSGIPDTEQSAPKEKTCDKVLPKDLGSYCDFTWGTKWDLTQSYLRFSADDKKYKRLFESLEDFLGYQDGLLSGVGYAESRHNQSAKSWASAYGVMQITQVGYQSLLSRYDAAKSLIEQYVDKDSLEDALLNKPESINKIRLTSKPSFDAILKQSPETAKLLIGMYNIRKDKKSRRDLKDIEKWKNVKKPSPEELEAIIRNVFVLLYQAVEFSKQKYFDDKLPSFEKIKEDAQTNIVVGALIYDMGRRELSILSHTLDENKKTHFEWMSPEAHKEKKKSAIHPDDLDIMAFSAYNAGLGATIFRLQVMHDELKNKIPLRIENALKQGAYFRQTRQGIRGIMRWVYLYDYLGAISDQFILEETQEEEDM